MAWDGKVASKMITYWVEFRLLGGEIRVQLSSLIGQICAWATIAGMYEACGQSGASVSKVTLRLSCRNPIFKQRVHGVGKRRKASRKLKARRRGRSGAQR